LDQHAKLFEVTEKNFNMYSATSTTTITIVYTISLRMKKPNFKFK